MRENTIEHNIDVMVLLSEALVKPNTLEEGLRRIVEMTCQLMGTTQAAFLLADEEKQLFVVRASVGIDNPNVRDGCPLVVPPRLHDILWKLQSIHQINWIDSGIEGVQFPIITMPIYFKGKRIGHLITGGAKDLGKVNDPLRRKLFALLAPFASLIIENAKATDLISRRFALNSQELLDDARRESAGADGVGTPADQLLVDSVRNPTKVVRLLAESFYNELVKAGFTPGHITLAASQIISCITREKNL